MTEITESNFDPTKHAVCVVDFWAPWCAPCHAQLPVLKKLAEELTNIPFFKANIEQNRSMVSQYEISSIPCIIIFKDGKVGLKMVGFQSESKLKDALQGFFVST
jgi:thioredoxin 1